VKFGQIVYSACAAVRHPAFLFSTGNTLLAVGQAEPIAMQLNILLSAAIFLVRFIEVLTTHNFGIPFLIVAIVNFLTALSIEFNSTLGINGSRLFSEGIYHLNLHAILSGLLMSDPHRLLSLNQAVLAGNISAFAYCLWAVGSLFAGWLEKTNNTAKKIKENPQTYYGLGDMSAVNASGNINPYSFAIMLGGFIKSIFIGHAPITAKNKYVKLFQQELTAARLYGIGYIVGAVTSFATIHFAIAQILWALAYFQFKTDT
jgi:hypothetical protein